MTQLAKVLADLPGEEADLVRLIERYSRATARERRRALQLLAAPPQPQNKLEFSLRVELVCSYLDSAHRGRS